MKLLGHKVLTGQLICLTGLRIGGSHETIEIGGLDNPVIREPLTGLPYVPGSSIKGKMRSLLEWHLGKISYDDRRGTAGPHSCKSSDCTICRVFGTSATDSTQGPTRLIVRDAFLTGKSRSTLEQMRQEKGLHYTEEKVENMIDRLTAKANPRTMERVPAGTEFGLEMVFRVFDTDDGGKTDEKCWNDVLTAMRLLQDDFLGSSGGRGYGKVAFKNLKVKYGDREETIEL